MAFFRGRICFVSAGCLAAPLVWDHFDLNLPLLSVSDHPGDVNLSCSFAHKGQLLQTSSHTHPASPRNTFNAKANCPCRTTRESVWEVGFF